MVGTQEPGDAPRGGGLGARLREARQRSFVGRQTERDLFREALAADVPPFAVLHLHGPGGVGKTALLQRFAHDAREEGLAPVLVDARDVDPSPAGFEAAVASVLGVGSEDALAVLRTQERPVLLVDTYEDLNPLDTWLRETLVPQLPARALVVLAGRRPPTAGWRADPGWAELLRVVALRDLRPDDARVLLSDRGIEPSRHDQVLQVTRGHPLALVLVADVLAHHDDTDFALEDAPEVIDGLLARFVRHAPDEAHRRALYAAAMAGTATEGLVRDTVPDADASALFDWLRELSFTEPVARGVAVHDLVRDALNAELRWRDPDGWASLHAAVTTHLERRVGRTRGVEQHRAMLDLLQLYRLHPLTRRYYDWERTEELWLDAATPVDHDAIVALVRTHEGDASARYVRYWLDRQPEAFTVFRGAGQEVAGFVAHLLLGDAPGEEVDVDPAAAAVWEHVRASAPMRAGERMRLMRFWMARSTYQDIATHHLVSSRSSLDWATTERLAWSFVVLADVDRFEPVFRFVDFERPDGLEVTVGDRTYGMFARDWRVTSRRAWRELLRDRRAGMADGLSGPQPEPDRLLVLSHEDFVDAVRDALRGVSRPGGLDDNPLLRSRVVVERAGDRPRDEVLTELLEEVTAELSGNPRDEKLQRALDRTYLNPAPTQEAAAERLGLPFSTFRRHLADGIDHVADRLWELELHGDPAAG